MHKSLLIYYVDAFSSKVFGGNPAAVCPLDNWLSDELMQKIAAENNLSETVFFTKSDESEYNFEIRWFTPYDEVDLCGHATLAASYVIFNKTDYPSDNIKFNSRSGLLNVSNKNDTYELDFPKWNIKPASQNYDMVNIIEIDAIEIIESVDLIAVLKSEKDLLSVNPRLDMIERLNYRGLVITSISEINNIDFVSRAFFPNLGIKEDPVTGSAHCALAPYWNKKLTKNELFAYQYSKSSSKLPVRVGELRCRTSEKDDRVFISGEARLYMEGKCFIE